MENCNVNDTGMEAYQKENQEVGEFVLQKYFLDQFHANAKNPYGLNIELIVSPRCNLGCKYCYVHRYRNEIFNEDVFDAEKTITNLKKFLEWMRVHEYVANIEIFSGELLAQDVGYQVLETIYEYEVSVPQELRPATITIPTNFTFICDADATARVEAIREKLKSVGTSLCLSASFDGKYMEQNRPYLHDLDVVLNGKGNRDDAYYDRCFTYAKDHGIGFHPMVYSKGIEKWKQNFDWFQEQMAKHGIPWEEIYLLQVRNEEWTQQNVWDLQDFIRYLYDFVWEHVGHNPQNIVDFLLHGRGFNLLAEPFTSTGRGLTCGIQGQFTVRLSDMMMYPCHRTGYKDFYYAQMIDDPDEIFKFKIMNAELLAATYSIHKQSFPYCATCPIKHLCVGTCLGAQYETTRNLFVPIPSVCVTMYAVVATSIECLKKYNAYHLMYDLLDENKRRELDYVEKEISKHDCK